ncbi:MAG: diguanylate cyclase [Mycolicibacterium sp.]|uniref:diguanylate cyclase domain-containing protein n=1 Tax=Mycolicibacterium sp. TaxID=2320850 RepID=UPI003D124B73
MSNTSEPETLADAVALLAQRDSDLQRARQQLALAHQELADTNRGLIALHTELQAAQQAQARLAAVVQSSDDAIVSMRGDGVIQTCNPGAERLLGHHEDGIVGQHVQSLMPASSREMFEASLRQLRRGERAQSYDTQWCRADGTRVDVTVNLCALRDAGGDLIGYSAIARDITAQVETQRQLQRLAQYDTLTGLVNRAGTIGRLEAALRSSRVPGPELGVLFCDIDHFKTVNDTWGHTVGDVVLATVAARIRGCVRHGDTVGRLGGDEILVLLPGVHGLEEVAAIAEKIRGRAAEPIEHGGLTIRATLSIGATLAVPGESVSTMTARSDQAMYEAKRAGRNSVTCG